MFEKFSGPRRIWVKHKLYGEKMGTKNLGSQQLGIQKLCIQNENKFLAEKVWIKKKCVPKNLRQNKHN